MIKNKPFGICPACGEAVSRDEQEVVWTCPSDLNTANPYYEELPGDWQKTDTEKEAAGYYANCPEGSCPIEAYGSGHLPLHAACYERGDY